MSERRKKTKSRQLPLLDEVNDLIEKERTLLQLKLLEQEKEVDEWKRKYDRLVDKVTEKTAESDFIESLEVVGEVEEIPDADKSISPADLNKLIATRNFKWVLDLSSASITVNIFTKLCKMLFGGRNENYEELKIAVFRDCELTDDHGPPLITIFQNPNIQAFDLSRNNLGSAFFKDLVTTLQDRRTTPQYILLDENTPLSKSVKSFSAIIDALTDHTWGFSITMQDFHPIQLKLKDTSKQKKMIKENKNEANEDYKELVKHPQKAAEFLKALNEKLHPSNIAKANQQLPERDKKSVFTQSQSSRSKRKDTTFHYGRSIGLQLMAVFALRNSQLSRRSVELLETTLELTSSTLTDLDLSFSYIGFIGAQVLQRTLDLPSCQLIRLGLMGNSISDRGASLICKSLQRNNTLVYLDLRSNGLSSTLLLGDRPGGLVEALCGTLRGSNGKKKEGNKLLPEGSATSVLAFLDLRGNDISEWAAVSLQQRLRDAGSILQIKWSDYETVPTRNIGPGTIPSVNTGELLYEYTNQMKVKGQLNKPIKLFSIDLTNLNLRYAYQYGHPLFIQWQWRPYSEFTSSINDAITQMLQHNHPSSTSSAYLGLHSQYSVSWEVRISYNSKDLFSSKKKILGSNSGLTRKIGSQDSSLEWVCSSTVVYDLPLKGVIDIYVTVSDDENSKFSGLDTVVTKAGGQGGVKETAVLSLEGTFLKVSHLPLQKPILLGGDTSLWGGKLNTITSSFSLSEALQHQELKQKALLRAFRWTYTAPNSHNKKPLEFCLNWESKLTLSGAHALLVNKGLVGELQSIENNPHAIPRAEQATGKLPPQHRSLGYDWEVVSYGTGGMVRVICGGQCLGTPIGDSEFRAEGEENVSAAETIAQGWSWHRYGVVIPADTVNSLQVDDVILVTAVPTSQQINYPPTLLQRCSVVARDFNVVVPPQEGELTEEGMTGDLTRKVPLAAVHDLDRDAASFFVSHNDGSFEIPA